MHGHWMCTEPHADPVPLNESDPHAGTCQTYGSGKRNSFQATSAIPFLRKAPPANFVAKIDLATLSSRAGFSKVLSLRCGVSGYE